jgi:hypothetical protein
MTPNALVLTFFTRALFLFFNFSKFSSFRVLINILKAVKAGQISISQLRLASINGDPNMIARCGIYLGYSLCQQGKRKEAIGLIKKIIYPYISYINCDKIVKSMYSALCYRVRHLDKYIK